MTRKVILLILACFLVLAAFFFLTAGTFAYWEAWVFLFILFTPMTGLSIYMLRNDPGAAGTTFAIQGTPPTAKRASSPCPTPSFSWLSFCPGWTSALDGQIHLWLPSSLPKSWL